MFNVCIMGRLTAEPELKQTQSGKSVCAFTIAVDDRKGQDKTTSYVRCVAWNGSAESLSRNFGKGKPIAVNGTGHINQNIYKDGTKHNDFELTVANWYFCGNKEATPATATAPAPIENNSNEFVPVVSEDEDLPF